MRLGRLVAGISILGLVGAGALSFSQNRTPHTSAEIALLTDRLFEFGAVDFVHAKVGGEHAPLFDCVAKGLVLTPAQSRAYRTAYQAMLLDNQRLFTVLDANLELRQDAGLGQPNNTGGTGIAGLHDHHDASAANNAVEIAQQLDALKTSGHIKRIALANDIYKDLTDLMVHMAPAAHSVGLLEMQEEGLGQSPTAYESFYRAMKAAQDTAINSAGYWQAVDTALAAYAVLVLDVQAEVRATNGAMVHAVSGQWLSLQTVAPRLGTSSPSAKDRQGTKAPCPVTLN